MEDRLLVPPGVLRPGVLGPLWPGTPATDDLVLFSTLSAPPVDGLEFSCEELSPPRVCLLVLPFIVGSLSLSLSPPLLPSRSREVLLRSSGLARSSARNGASRGSPLVLRVSSRAAFF